MTRLNVTCDCGKCGHPMQMDEILSNDEMRSRLYFKCYNCKNEVVVNRWWKE
jgi:hypothetical protein